MAACDTRDWRIILRIDAHPEIDEAINFKEISISGGVIVGKVFDASSGGFMSVLRGRCTPATATGHTDMSHLEFVFNVIDAQQRTRLLLLQGVASLAPGENDPQEFRGSFRAFLPYSSPFSVTGAATTPTGRLDTLSFDEGDMGTGTGTQT